MLRGRLPRAVKIVEAVVLGGIFMSLEAISMKSAFLGEYEAEAAGLIEDAGVILLEELNLAFEKILADDLIIFVERSVEKSRQICSLALATEAGEEKEEG